MNKLIALVVLGLSFTPAGMAQDQKDTRELYEKKSDKERIYKVAIETLWSACIKTAAEDNVIDYSNEKEGIITFETGQTKATWGFKISVSITKIDDTKTRVKLVTKKKGIQLVRWGAEGRRVKEYFEALDKKLAEEQK